MAVRIPYGLKRGSEDSALTSGCAAEQVYAMLVEMRVGHAAGFDLSVMDRYRWHPGLERVQLDRRRSLATLQ